MSRRREISKSVRFEVFKRDAFTCQYCGKKAPDVILEVDHIIPVAEGGSNDMINLVTSCRDCNRGKSAKLLSDSSAVEKQRRQMEDMNEMQEQLQMMIEWRKGLMQIEERLIDEINDLMKRVGMLQSDECLNASGRNKISTLIKKFGFSEVWEAVEIANDAYIVRRKCDFEVAFSKIGGICWNRKNQREQRK